MSKSLLPKKLRGKYVTRAAFAKMQGEKQRLERDIYTLVMVNTFKAIQLRMEYKKKFEKNEEIGDMLKEIAKAELPKLKAKLDSNPKAFK